jgi:hypothetical protein
LEKVQPVDAGELAGLLELLVDGGVGLFELAELLLGNFCLGYC